MITYGLTIYIVDNHEYNDREPLGSSTSESKWTSEYCLIYLYCLTKKLEINTLSSETNCQTRAPVVMSVLSGLHVYSSKHVRAICR